MLRALLEDLAGALADVGEASHAATVREIAESSDGAIYHFLASNELWGGSGSIADSAGIGSSPRARRRIERILARLGQAQLERGIINPRTKMWTESF